MILRWLICFSFFAGVVSAANLTGHVRLTGTKTKDLSGVVVWLEAADAGAAVHGDGHVTMAQKDKTFAPHILAITSGTTVDFPNFDPIFHNAFSSFDGKVFDVGLYPPGSSRSVRFDRAGIVRVFCNIHPTMSAVIVVLNTAWFGVSSKDGSFRIEGIPEGEYTLRVYHERATEMTLAALTRSIAVHQEHVETAPISISETGYLPAPHKNKYGKEYPHEITYSEHQQ